MVDIRATTAELLSAFPVFGDLELVELEQIANQLHTRIFADDAFVFRKGDRADGLYFIASGAIEIKVGKEIYRLGHGDFFGEMALLDEAHRSADVKSISYSHLLLLRKDTFENLSRSYPNWRNRLADIADKRKAINEAQNNSDGSLVS